MFIEYIYLQYLAVTLLAFIYNREITTIKRRHANLDLSIKIGRYLGHVATYYFNVPEAKFF